MNKKELINKVRSILPVKMTKTDLEQTLDSILDAIITGLNDDGKVMISNFGTFERVEYQPYWGVHPITGEKIKIDGGYRINFTSSKKTKASIK